MALNALHFAYACGVLRLTVALPSSSLSTLNCRSVARDDELWKELCITKFNVPRDEHKPFSWKQLYRYSTRSDIVYSVCLSLRAKQAALLRHAHVVPTNTTLPVGMPSCMQQVMAALVCPHCHLILTHKNCAAAAQSCLQSAGSIMSCCTVCC